MDLYGSSMTGSAVRPTSPRGIVRLVSDNHALQHYGVPGQKWGVITKEYEPVAVDKRKIKKATSVNPPVKMRRTVGNSLSAKWEKEKAELQKDRQTMRRNIDNRDKMARNWAYAGIAVAGLLAAYGMYRYTHVTKAKAYSGLLERFMSQNPDANLRSEGGRQLLQKGIHYAEANSKKFSAAKATNAYLKKRGLLMKAKDANRIYKARHLIKKCSVYTGGGSKFKQAVYRARKSRLTKRLLSNYIV